MILLRLISWPYAEQAPAANDADHGGIVLGVALFVGMNTANRSVVFAFSERVERIAGKTELQVTAGETGLMRRFSSESRAAGVCVWPFPASKPSSSTNMRAQGNILVLGVDMTGDRSLRDYDLESGDEAVIDDPLVFLAQPDSIMVLARSPTRNVCGRERLSLVRRGRKSSPFAAS